MICVMNEIGRLLPPDMAKRLNKEEGIQNGRLQEIRLRIERPIAIKTDAGVFFLKDCLVSQRELKETVERLGGYSLYAVEEELKQGYMTVEGGHRVGFCGRAVMEDGRVKTLRHISSLNIRIAGEVKGCAEPWLPYLYENGRFCHTLIVSPPGCGKTTLLRDLVRCLSYGWADKKSCTVGVVDERGEIAAMKAGVPQMDIGPATDVQENCPKAEGMVFLLRSMTPEIIAVDELGKEADLQGVEALLYAGVTLISTVHGSGVADLQQKPNMERLLRQMTPGRLLILSNRCGTGTVEMICDSAGKMLYEREGRQNATGNWCDFDYSGNNSYRHFPWCKGEIPVEGFGTAREGIAADEKPNFVSGYPSGRASGAD